MTPSKNAPPVIVSVCAPSDTLLVVDPLNSAPTLAPALVWEMSRVPTPPLKATSSEFAIEPTPLSASVAPESICVVLV